METYSCCNEWWFQMHLATHSDDIDVYKAYVRDTKSLKNPSEPFLFSDANNINLGAIPKYLPTLTKVKKIIIARVHVHLQVARVRGQQYQYTKYIICFGQNTPKTQRQLPLLPIELNILIIRPTTSKGNHQLYKQFYKRFTIRRSTIEVQLYFLKSNHPAYTNIKIIKQRLASLPKDDSILN